MSTDTDFDVAIVGGGVIGLSIAAELRRAGVPRVVVLEREGSVGQGSSARANGGFRAQFTTPINIEFSLYSIGKLKALDQETDGLPGLHQVGYLFLTGDADVSGLAEARELQRSLGVDTEWLTPARVHELAPVVRTEGLTAATFHGGDGFLDPHGLVAAIKKEAQSQGALIRPRAEVQAIERGADGRFSLGTAAGPVAADWVVDAAGPDARRVGEMAGVEVPVDPVRRNMVFTPDPSGDRTLIPMCVDLDTGVLVRKERSGGFVLAYSNPEDPPGWDTTVDPVFLQDLAERIGNRFPSLLDLPIEPRHCWAGLYPETPDHHSIIGEAAERFFVCVGFGGHGLMHSPAAGKAVAESIADGRCTTFDLHPLRPSRFEEGDLVVEKAVL